MKRFTLILITILAFSGNEAHCQAFFKRAKPGLSLAYSYNLNGDYVYLLNQDASLTEVDENHSKFTSTLVTLFPFRKYYTEEEKAKFRKEGVHFTNRTEWYVVISAPLFDLELNDVAVEISKQTPLGLGVCFFPFYEKNFGFIFNTNFGTSDRMRDQALKNQRFPIKLYPDLMVNTPVPYTTLDPYMKKVFNCSFNVGLVLKP